ncbi:MAG TPA: discoidin domain-containing protein [Phycisphaerae bacterium]|nr:discoidin domain-containing protein [Phycisphaerae bacterium]
MNTGFRVASLALAGALLGGCVGSPISGEGRTAPAAAISPRRMWKAYGTLSGAAKAIDGSPSTAAVAGVSQGNTDLTIDLGKACVFNLVRIDHGGDEFGFARRVELSTSLDGESFAKVHETPGTRRATYVCPITPILARYLRLKVLVPGVHPWSVAEVTLR